MSDNSEHGSWVKVTKPSEVKVGDRVRYIYKDLRFGFVDEYREIVRVSPTVDSDRCEDIFEEGVFDSIEVFRPAKPTKRKAARCNVYRYCEGVYRVQIWVASWNFELHDYGTRRDALRGARRFCKKIGYECEIMEVET